MGASSLNPIKEKTDLFVDGRSASERVRETHTEEIIIGLCGPIGTNIHNISDSIKHVIENEYDYKCTILTLSKFISKYGNPETKYSGKGSDYFIRKKEAILKGNELRKSYGPSILAEFAIRQIGYERIEKRKGDEKFESRRECYIIDSLKNSEELEILRTVYRDLFYFIGVFSPVSDRIKYLENEKQLRRQEIEDLIDNDSGEEVDYGQDVRNTFMQSDFFLRIQSDSPKSIKERIRRFLSLVFDTEIVTPTIEESAMYAASIASYNSGCLSRQVGATITDKNGNILSTGWNDVPTFGGNLYQSDKKDPHGDNDKRCYNLVSKDCYNDKHKALISKDLVELLLEQEIIKQDQAQVVIDIINKSKIKGLIEFSRAIHAEMHAIILGSQKTGDKMIGGKLFSTTYPCHNCARHIVVAGIKEVYYIEPYIKSLGKVLHFDSITEDEAEDDKVRMLMYDGVAPNRFNQFFKIGKISRKQLSKKIEEADTSTKKTKPKFSESLEALATLESLATRSLDEKGLK